MMKDSIIAKLTSKDDKYACAFADKIILESQETDEWYEYFNAFASLLNPPKVIGKKSCVIYSRCQCTVGLKNPNLQKLVNLESYITKYVKGW